ncbi:MAG: ATP-binding cassette domain-containing protein [Nitrospiraceae bacterium]
MPRSGGSDESVKRLPFAFWTAPVRSYFATTARLSGISRKRHARPQLSCHGTGSGHDGPLRCAGLFRRPSSQDRAIALEALAHVGMDHHRDSALGALSGGQQQRVFIARALAQQPRILLLDEPTTGLDLTAQHGVVDLIQTLHRTLKLTILMITHDINMIRSRVDRLVLLKTRLFAAGPPQDVLKPEILSQVYGKELVITDKDFILVEDYHHHH